MDRWNDKDLETLFRRMREEEVQFSPGFAKMWDDGVRTRSRQRLRSFVATIFLTAACVAAVVWGMLPTASESDRIADDSRLDSIDFETFSAVVVEQFRDPLAVAWRSPTNYLLKPEVDRPVSRVWWDSEPVTN